MYIFYFSFSVYVIIILYVVQYTLYYLTQPSVILGFLNPQNPALYNSHNYE